MDITSHFQRGGVISIDDDGHGQLSEVSLQYARDRVNIVVLLVQIVCSLWGGSGGTKFCDDLQLTPIVFSSELLDLRDGAGYSKDALFLVGLCPHSMKTHDTSPTFLSQPSDAFPDNLGDGTVTLLSDGLL